MVKVAVVLLVVLAHVATGMLLRSNKPPPLESDTLEDTKARYRLASADPFKTTWPITGPIVDIPGLGKVKGATSWQGVSMFRSLPYAQPPVEDLRWRPPQPLTPWDGVKDCSQWGPICPQLPGAINLTMFNQSEDCLAMYVFSPLGYLNTETKLPVMVWIVGDAFIKDSPVHYVGQNLVYATEYKSVVVTLGYRLNTLGFLASPELMQRAEGQGQLGFQDQQFALKFIQQNIATFAGDPTKVCIFGISSGGGAVMTHLVMPRSAGLFQRAIIMSGFYSEMTVNQSTAFSVYDKVLQYTHCKDLACLLKLPAIELVRAGNKAANGEYVFNPLIDGVNLKGKPWDLIAAGEFNKGIPVLLGSVRDEMSKFMLFDNVTWPNTMTDKQGQTLLKQLYPVGEEWLKELNWAYSTEAGYDYPTEQWGYSKAYWLVMRIRSDDIFGHCSERWLARRLLENGSPAVWLYMFNHRIKPAVFVPHGSDDHWVFGPLNNTLELQMMSYWSSFANTGDPNSGAPGVVQWPAYDLVSDQNIKIQQKGTTVDSHFRHNACMWWDKYHAKYDFTSKTAPLVCTTGPPCAATNAVQVLVLNQEKEQIQEQPSPEQLHSAKHLQTNL